MKTHAYPIKNQTLNSIGFYDAAEVVVVAGRVLVTLAGLKETWIVASIGFVAWAFSTAFAVIQ